MGNIIDTWFGSGRGWQIVGEEDYKQKLQKRNHSAITPDQQQQSKQHQTESDPINEEEEMTENTPKLAVDCSTQTPTDKEVPIVSMEDFEVVDLNDKLNLLMPSMNKINTNFHHRFESLSKQMGNEKEGLIGRITLTEHFLAEIQARMDDVEERTAATPQYNIKVSVLEERVQKLSDDVATIKGLLQVQDTELKMCKNKIVDLTARSMSNNITISGITGDVKDEKEDCVDKVKNFLQEKLDLEFADQEIEVAHRLGTRITAKLRLMVVRCKYHLKERILKNSYKLKDKVNAQGDFYHIKPQLPEPLQSEKVEREKQLRAIKNSPVWAEVV